MIYLTFLDLSTEINIGQEQQRQSRPIFSGGDWLSLFETRPLEDILADIAEGWGNTQRCMGRVRSEATAGVAYVL